MSSRDIAVSARGLSKAYQIAHDEVKHVTLGETLLHKLKNPFAKPERETFWALKDINFDIMKGDVVGIIGRNGAGKSTLLKVLSQITEPTQGQIDLYGRVGSLLEVGTGFHPELTGRENVYMNGAILGMSRSEITRQFDAIVDFSGTEKFLDTPVKRYSSGMYVRLAFAVAAHLNPEILIVDEVLAVGDAEFQKKCLGKMKDVSTSGRTVLFVSHNMTAVRSLCSAGIVLHKGNLLLHGKVDQCVAYYTNQGLHKTQAIWERETPKRETKILSFERVSVELIGQQPNYTLEVQVTLKTHSTHNKAFMAVDITDATGGAVMQALPVLEGFIADNSSIHKLKVEICLPPIVPGQYMLTLWVGSHNTETLDEVKECVGFEIEDSPTMGRTVPHTPADHGYIVPPSAIEYFVSNTVEQPSLVEAN